MTDDTTEGALTTEETNFFDTAGESGLPETAAETTDSSETALQAAPDRPTSHVPLAALQEERGRRRALDRELREAREKLANFEGRFAVLERAGRAEEPAQAGPPDPEDDIFGAVRAIQHRIEGHERAAYEAQVQSARQARFVSDYQADAAQFRQGNPDYMDAYNYLLQTRAAELRAIGYDEPQALHQALSSDEIGIAQMAFAKGKSPAEMIYALAKQRGYRGGGNASDRLDTIARGQAANKSLNNTGGSVGDSDMTVERLLSMPMSEFETWVEKNPTKARRLMGG